MIHCVTTMSKKYYDMIGKIMIHTWKERFPKNYTLHLYLEDFTIPVEGNVVIEDWKDVEDLYKIWSSKRFSNKEKHQKFTKKALAQIAFFRKYNNNKVFWVDADMVFLKPIDEGFFDRVLENNAIAAWGAAVLNDVCLESGTLFIDTGNQNWKRAQAYYESIYIGDRGLLGGERWWDGDLLGKSLQETNVPYKDLRQYCTKKSSVPINRSWIGEYMRHFMSENKSRLKQELIDEFGRTDLIDMLTESDLVK